MEQLVTVGQQLKVKREGLGLSLDDIASQTFIQKFNLQALEDDAFDRIVGEVYIKGFLSQYAEALKLNSKEILTLYRQQVSQSNPEESAQPQLPKQVQVKSKIVPILISICILGSIIAMVLIFVPGEQTESTTLSPLDESTKVIEITPKNSASTEDQTTLNSTTTQLAADNSNIPNNEITDSTWPPIPASGATIRLQAVSSAILEVTIDNLPTTRHSLLPGSKIEWNPKNSAHFYMIENGDLNLSMNDSPLEFNIMGIIDLTQE